MFGFISQGTAGLVLIAFGNIFLGCCMLAGAAVWIATTDVGTNEE